MTALTAAQQVHLARLEAHPAPHHRAIATLAHKFNADPAFQYKLHLVGTYVFIAQIGVVVLLFAFASHFWTMIAVLYLTIVSLLANAQTEACNLPSAEAAIEARKIRQTAALDVAAIERDLERLARLQPGTEADELAAEIRAQIAG